MNDTRIIAAFLSVITAVLIVIVLKTLKTIFIPLIFAALLSIMLKPVLSFLNKRKIPSWVSLTLVFLAVFFLLYLVGSVVYAGVASFAQEFPKYETSLRRTLETSLNQINLRMDDFQAYFYEIDWSKHLQNFSIGNTISKTLGSFFTFLGYTLLILIFTLFLLSGQMHISQKIHYAFSDYRSGVILGIIRSIQNKVRTYLLTKFFVSLMTALVGFIFVLIFGVDFAIITALLLFVLNFIPNIGSFIASAFPIVICFLEYGFSWRLPALTLCLAATQITFGNFIEPMLMGRGLNLQPLVVILSLIFWGWVWGVVGMVLAVPLTSTFVIICESIEALRPLAVLMSGSKSIDLNEMMERR